MRKPKHHHSDRDRIWTPVPLAIKLIRKIPSSPEDTWCDPCLGKGAFFDNFPVPELQREWYEIDLDRDYLKAGQVSDWTVTNIPFSLPKEFIFKMAECSRKGFGILCLANSMTATRLKKLEGMGFYLHNQTVVYVRDWGFGYRTDFYVFTRNPEEQFETIID